MQRTSGDSRATHSTTCATRARIPLTFQVVTFIEAPLYRLRRGRHRGNAFAGGAVRADARSGAGHGDCSRALPQAIRCECLEGAEVVTDAARHHEGAAEVP